MPLLCVWPSVQRCHRHVKIVDMYDQSIRTTLCFADSSEVCFGIVILGLALSLVFAQKRQGNRPQHLIHVQLTDQMSLYNHQSCRPRFKTSPSPEGPCER